MRKDSMKLLIIAGIVGFAILYGMELSSGGISQVYGPLETSVSRQGPAEDPNQDWTLPPRKTERRAAIDTPDIAFPRNDHVPIVDRISGKTAETLHALSSGGIRLIVSLFDRVTGS